VGFHQPCALLREEGQFFLDGFKAHGYIYHSLVNACQVVG
jgi:hypothetical protein